MSTSNSALTNFDTKQPTERLRTYNIIYGILFLICILYAIFTYWHGYQPIDEQQKTILKTLAEDVAKAENRSIQGVWDEVHKTYGVYSYTALTRNDYDDLFDRFSLRLQK